jgi:hypothetical protein
MHPPDPLTNNRPVLETERLFFIKEEDFQQPIPGMEAAYTAYQTALKVIFQNIINGRLADASLSLLEVSEWLLGHVVDLGKFVFLLFDLAH